MVLCLLILGALLPFHQRLKARLPDGALGLVYFAIYGAGRFFLSFLRTDPGVFLGMRQAQIASFLVVAVAIIAVPALFRRAEAAAVRVPATPARAESTHEPPREQQAPSAPQRSRGRRSRRRNRAADENKPPN
jgi:prolipoprotein diacylglyceryltransferase